MAKFCFCAQISPKLARISANAAVEFRRIVVYCRIAAVAQPATSVSAAAKTSEFAVYSRCGSIQPLKEALPTVGLSPTVRTVLLRQRRYTLLFILLNVTIIYPCSDRGHTLGTSDFDSKGQRRHVREVGRHSRQRPATAPGSPLLAVLYARYFRNAAAAANVVNKIFHSQQKLC